jgi:hypothetical protein
MADWYGSSRTNYIKFKDLDGLKKALEPFPVTFVAGIGERAGTYYLTSLDETGSLYRSYQDENDEQIFFDFAEHVCPYMEDDQILVVIEVGAERLRYLTGDAAAYNAAGEFVVINLNHIYDRAKEVFGHAPQSRAEY